MRTLEELGIGRPSTYAPTLETIQKRGYVAIEEKKFVPTELGELVIQLMEEFFPEILECGIHRAHGRGSGPCGRRQGRLGQSARRISTNRSRSGLKLPKTK